MNGWLALPRSILDGEWYVQADAFTRALWLHLMMRANFAQSVTRAGLALNPGQLVTSWGSLALAMKAHPSKVRRAAAFLAKAGEATFQPTGRPTYTGTVVTLERWAVYASGAEQPTDHPASEATDGMSGGRQHCKNTTGPVGPKEYRPSTGPELRERMAAFAERCKRDAQELREVRAREAVGTRAHDTAATDGSVH